MFVVDLKAHRDYHLQIVVHHVTADLSAALGLNYPEIPDSS